MSAAEEWASRYISKYGLALVPIPPGHKAPLHPGWNQRGGYVTDAGEARQRWNDLPDHGIGAVLGPSGLCSLDVDTPEHAEPVLGELGIDLGGLRKATPTIQGNPSRYRLMFRAPPGVALGRKTLTWPARQPGEKPLTLFELRAGDIQDVLPPTIHPGTGKPYIWQPPPNSEFPLLPNDLLELWQHWDSYGKELEAMCPWAPQTFRPELSPRGNGARPNVIAEFNRVHSVEDLLKEHDYTPKGKRWLSPTSSSKLAGVTVLDGGRVYSHHGSDPLADGHAHDAFDLFRLLDHGGDTRASIKAAAEDLGMGSTAGAKAPAGDEDTGASPGGSCGGEEWTEPPLQAPSYPEIPPLDALRIDPAELDTARLTPQCVVESYLYADVAAFPGPGGTGKTTLFLFEVVHIVLGRTLYGLTLCTSGTVVIVTAEDRRELLIARLGRIMEALELDAAARAKVCARAMIWDVTGTVCRLTELDRQGNVVLTGLADAIVERFRDSPPVMIGLDPVISFGAGERIVNDNEHSLILAARRIVRGLGCCVRLICHTGKEVARSGLTDQYSARGGSALSDGARMVTVLRAWGAGGETTDKLIPPIGFALGPDETGMVLVRAKLSYAPLQPQIWLKRRGYGFEHFIATRPDPAEAEGRARANQLKRYLIAELARGSRYTRNTLTDTGVIKPRDKLRAALSALEAAGRVIDAPMPRAQHRRGGRRTYLHPVAFASPSPDDEANENTPENDPLPRRPDPPFGSPPSYRGKNGGEAKPPPFPLSLPRSASEAPRSNGEASEANEVGDIQDQGTEDLDRHVGGATGPDQIQAATTGGGDLA